MWSGTAATGRVASLDQQSIVLRASRVLAQGMEADIIGLDGDPATDAAAFARVVFVMRAGRVYKNEAAARSGPR